MGQKGVLSPARYVTSIAAAEVVVPAFYEITSQTTFTVPTATQFDQIFWELNEKRNVRRTGSEYYYTTSPSESSSAFTSGFYNPVSECGDMKGLQVLKTVAADDVFKFATDTKPGNYGMSSTYRHRCPLDAACTMHADCMGYDGVNVQCKAGKCTAVPKTTPEQSVQWKAINNNKYLQKKYFNSSTLASTVAATVIAVVTAVFMF